jgi:hypothetical protein
MYEAIKAMTLLDRGILLLTGLIAIYMLSVLFKKQKEKPGTENIFFIISFAVLLVAGLILIFTNWNSLLSPFVAIVAGLIPFGLAIGLIKKFYPKYYNLYVIVLLVGLIWIAVAKIFDVMCKGSVALPLFHAIAGLTIFFVPICAVKAGKVKAGFINVTIGGTLIGLGGIALAFIKNGKQLLFFSPHVVLSILAPLLFLTALFFALGLTKE